MGRKFKTYCSGEREDVRRAFWVHCRDRDLSDGAGISRGAIVQGAIGFAAAESAVPGLTGENREICSQPPLHLAMNALHHGLNYVPLMQASNFQEIIGPLRQLYLDDPRPWLVGLTGGKNGSFVRHNINNEESF